MASKYTKEQVEEYYTRISLPQKLRIYDVSDLTPKAALAYLGELLKCHLLAVPFENLSLHYSPHRIVVLHPDELFRKVIKNKRGGYCMELNAVFGTLLRSLNYSLYNVGARVHNGNDFGPWGHMLNIVTVGDSRYVVDVGFGSSYVPTRPIRLINDSTGFSNVSPASARLVFKALEGSSNPYQKLWVYQHRTGSDSDFRDMYCFADLEFRAADFEMMNYWTSTNPKTIFTQMVICNKLIAGEDGEMVGTMTLMKNLKKRTGTKTEVLMDFTDEEQRVKALEEYFGILLTGIEKESIQGTANEIR